MRWWWLHLAGFGVAASAVVPLAAPLANAVPFAGPFLPALLTYAAGAVSHAIISTVRKNVDPNFNG